MICNISDAEATLNPCKCCGTKPEIIKRCSRLQDNVFEYMYWENHLITCPHDIFCDTFNTLAELVDGIKRRTT